MYVLSCCSSYDKPYGKLALGQNCIKIISDKSVTSQLCFCESREILKAEMQKQITDLTAYNALVAMIA